MLSFITSHSQEDLGTHSSCTATAYNTSNGVGIQASSGVSRNCSLHSLCPIPSQLPSLLWLRTLPLELALGNLLVWSEDLEQEEAEKYSRKTGICLLPLARVLLPPCSLATSHYPGVHGKRMEMSPASLQLPHPSHHVQTQE